VIVSESVRASQLISVADTFLLFHAMNPIVDALHL
jgi:hypothetical protein